MQNEAECLKFGIDVVGEEYVFICYLYTELITMADDGASISVYTGADLHEAVKLCLSGHSKYTVT